ncbi:hypothetical protein ABIE26_005345 [Pedobacter africanus]|uniref:Uncharacterized protein n=1 Tax=Pedobacter africanus TaxID=151894 RepID=A0ACC6L593_9SPHI|nr:hypothetical protein [Pedobacter africanus]
MEKSKPSLYQAATKVWNKAIKIDTPYTKDLELTLELHKRLLNIFQVGNHYYMIFNVCTLYILL